ncbi:helix-turn-helix domain-containing protein [Acetivibrio mesophilus]|uniref:helix-turn-helix domain-containing protein n=1 Tax=Acetivibrio mesophilus TaxID=2487273 RepID=UPI001F3734C1|nr:helix-turn-helix domain-containing protein [Acetivibrio mesophilus]
MIKLHQKQEIILMRFREDISIRAIAKEVGVDRKTVRKYIRQYEQQRQQLMHSGDVQPTELIESIVQPPKYDTSKRKPLKVTDEVLERIKYYLNENQSKRLKGQSKQVMKKIDIFEALKNEGFDIGYTTVCQTISKMSFQSKEAFIRENYSPVSVVKLNYPVSGKKMPHLFTNFHL